MLQLVTAVIKPHRLEEVKDALKEIGVAGITVSEVRGFGRQRGHTEVYRGSEYTVDFVPKLKLELVCEAEMAEKAAEVIVNTAATGTIGDGKLWITPVETIVRIRTGEKDVEAL